MQHFLYFTWEHKDFGIDLGFFIIRAYSLMWALAFILGFLVMKHIVFKTEKVSDVYLEPFLFYTLVGCMLGARLGHVLFYQTELIWEHPLAVLLPISPDEQSSFLGINGYRFSGYQGLASHGATIGMIISTLLFHRKFPKLNLLWLFDRLVMAVPIGGALIRIGNFFNSEIVGKESDLPWAVKFMYQSAEYGNVIPRHPAQLYEALGYIILFLMLYFIYTKTDKRNYKGWMFGFFFVILWTIRFIVEFFKEPQGSEKLAQLFGNSLNNGQLLSIPFIIFGFYLMFVAKQYNQPPIKE